MKNPYSTFPIADNLVSIVTPAYNSVLLIGKTIESVLCQSYPSWELIIVIDAGTKDNTAELVKRYCQADSRIKLIEINDKRGISLSRNAALSAARGEWIAFLDSDDLWLPYKLEKQLLFMKEKEATFSCTGYRKISQNEEQTGELRLPPEEQSYTDILGNNLISCPTVMFNQKHLGTFKMLEHPHEDYILWLEIIKKAKICFGLQEDLARYRIVVNSRSMNVNRSGSRWIVLRKIEKLSFIKSCYYFGKYAVTAIWKRLAF